MTVWFKLRDGSTVTLDDVEFSGGTVTGRPVGAGVASGMVRLPRAELVAQSLDGPPRRPGKKPRAR